LDLSRRKIFITGGTSGIGLELARQLTARGAQVAVCARSVDRLARLGNELPQISTFSADLGDVPQLPDLVRQLLVDFGPPSVLINNAGIQINDAWSDIESTARLTAIQSEIAVNLVSPLALTALLLDSLAQTPGATVVNVTSALAWKPKRSAPVYCATKAALRSFTDGMRLQLEGAGIRMVEAVPALVETPMTQGRGSGKISAAEAATAIIRGLKRDADRIYIGKAKLLAFLYRVSPNAVARILRDR
jgi:uncharacterized oxidoreductase